MATKHTPAPWIADKHDVWAGKNTDILVCVCFTPNTKESDAKLIAAAPELLEALVDVLDAFERYTAGYSKGYEINTVICEQAKNAIAKARGES